MIWKYDKKRHLIVAWIWTGRVRRKVYGRSLGEVKAKCGIK
jgi:hypothetical protein